VLYYLLYPLSKHFIVFNVFKYITFRSIGATLTALALGLFLGPLFIKALQKRSVGQAIREDVPKRHRGKSGTPTMGGLLILVSILLAVLLWADVKNIYIWVAVAVLLGYGAIGIVDDILKITRAPEGMGGWRKLGLEALIALLIALILFSLPEFTMGLTVPFFKRVAINMGWFYLLFAVFVIVGASNAVNLTDGLDGLAIGPVMTSALVFMVFSYATGHVKFSEYLKIPHIPGIGELSVFCGALIGAGLGFLWFNAYPAQMFMGDVGSLALGGALGGLALLTKQEILLALVGGIFVWETISVIMQVISFKWKGKRVLLMAPIHHHFELRGWEEPKITVRFWIISVILALLALSTLKLR